MPYPVSDLAKQALRNGVALTYTVNASLGGVPVVGAQNMRPTGGSITDTTKAGVRRVLNLDLAPSPGLFDLLSPIGTTLTVTGHVRFTDRTTLDVPMGVFDVDSEKLSEGGGGLSLTAPDKWVRIQRARFLSPQPSEGGIPVTDQIIKLIRGALGNSEPVNVTATSGLHVGTLVWEKDRDKAIQELAASIGAWVYFDRNGVATIADLPTIGASADWLVDASASGVLTELSRERARATTYNIVVVSSSATDGELFKTQYIWDSDPASPTFAGTGSGASATPPDPSTAGPFGQVPYYFDSPIIDDASAAWTAGRTILARTVGAASSVSLGMVPNPAIDAFDVIDVLAPRERYDIPRGYERHVADTVTHSLSVGTATQIDGRSTRTDDYS